MSWDVLILHPERAGSAENHAQLRPLGMADEVRRAVARVLSGIEWIEPLQGVWRGRAVTVDVELPSKGVVDSFALHLRGPGNPFPLLVRLCRQNGWVAFDSAAGAFVDLDHPAPESWESALLRRAQTSALARLHRKEEQPRRLSRRQLLGLVPWLLTLHNLEEALFLKGFPARVAAVLPDFVARLLPPVTERQILLALAVVTLIPWLFAASGPLDRRSRAFYLVMGTQMVMLLNVASHAATAILLRGYAPGLVTALLVNLPFSLYLFRRALRGGWLRPAELAWLVVAAALVHGPGLIGLMVLAGGAWG